MTQTTRFGGPTPRVSNTVAFQCPHELRLALEAIAQKYEISLSAAIRQACAWAVEVEAEEAAAAETAAPASNGDAPKRPVKHRASSKA